MKHRYSPALLLLPAVLCPATSAQEAPADTPRQNLYQVYHDYLCESEAARHSLRAGFAGAACPAEAHLLGTYYNGAVLGGHAEIVRHLLTKGAEARPGLNLAAETGDLPLFELLFEHAQAQQQIRPADLEKYIQTAAGAGHRPLVQHLLQKGASATHGAAGAAYGGRTELLEYLLERGGSATYACKTAAHVGNRQLVELLLRRGAKPTPALMAAIYNNHSNIALILLQHGAETQEALHFSIRSGNKELLSLLLPYTTADTGLHFAAQLGDTELVRLQLQRGANPDSGLYSAALQGDAENVQLLLAHGGHPDLAFAAAAAADRPNILHLVLQSGAPPSGGLKYAVRCNRTEMLKILLTHPGANVNQLSNTGETPLDEALSRGLEECATLLRAAGGKLASEIK